MLNLIIPVAALIGLGFFAKNKGEQLLNGLSFEPVDIEFNKNSLGLLSTRFTVKIKIINKSNVAIPISSVSGQINDTTNKNNPVLLSNFNIQNSFTVPANGSIVLPLEITASNLETLLLIYSIIKTGKTPVIAVSGGAFAGPVKAPINLVYQSIKLFTKK